MHDEMLFRVIKNKKRLNFKSQTSSRVWWSFHRLFSFKNWFIMQLFPMVMSAEMTAISWEILIAIHLRLLARLRDKATAMNVGCPSQQPFFSYLIYFDSITDRMDDDSVETAAEKSRWFSQAWRNLPQLFESSASHTCHRHHHHCPSYS